MFFARCVVYIGGFLPKGKFYRHFCLLFDHDDCKNTVVAWHRAELERLDLMFSLQQDSLRLGAAYDEAEAKGISPLDPRYPNLLASSEIDWEEEARVHAYVLDRFKKTGDERMQRLDEAVREYPQERVDAVMEACASALRTRSPD